MVIYRNRIHFVRRDYVVRVEFYSDTDGVKGPMLHCIYTYSLPRDWQKQEGANTRFVCSRSLSQKTISSVQEISRGRFLPESRNKHWKLSHEMITIRYGRRISIMSTHYDTCIAIVQWSTWLNGIHHTRRYSSNKEWYVPISHFFFINRM